MLLRVNLLLLLCLYKTKAHLEQPNARKTQIIGTIHESRRIIKGTEIIDTRPYMVYLRATISGKNKPADANWLCGGVIVHSRYILTSAACIEDVVQFYIVSGTHKWLPPASTNECIINGAMKAVWKCVPKTYRYDGFAFNNIHWMANDIAVVMTDKPFNFNKRVKGCDFIPKMIRYNNQSQDLESPGTKGSIAGWGSTSEYNDPTDLAARSNVNSPLLLETEVVIMPKDTCQALWLPRYEAIIRDHMICGKSLHFDEMSQACEDNHLECRHLIFSEEDGGTLRRVNGPGKARRVSDHHLLKSLARAKDLKARRKSLRRDGKEFGGFCENDHGGPMVVGQGRTAQVVGIISAYKTMNNSKRCVGPFLYTSVYNNRHLINCAIFKEIGTQCRTVLRTSSTVLDQNNIDWPEENWHKIVPKKKKEKKKRHRQTSTNSSRKVETTTLSFKR